MCYLLYCVHRMAAELLLIEKGEDQILRRAKAGEPFAGIADNWRVFFTANLRGTGNKLSSAFLNRVILISLEPMDAVCHRMLSLTPSGAFVNSLLTT
jgi:hypothetical protein